MSKKSVLNNEIKLWQQLFCFVCINRRSCLCIRAWCWCVIFVCSHCAMPTRQRIWDIWLWQNIFHTHTVISVTLWSFFGCRPVHRLWCSAERETRRDVYRGSYATWAGPWWTRFYYTGPVSQTASRSVSFGGKSWERVKTRAERRSPRCTAVRQVFPPVNHNPQNCSNDAGSLKRPAGWNWVKKDLMSHSLHWGQFLSIITGDMMTSKTATELCSALRWPYYWCK